MNTKLAYFPQIDALRFYAVFLVLISHWIHETWIEQLILGRWGVELFFVISGFLITRILFVLKESNLSIGLKLKHFFIRRVLRIFPIYYFVVIVTALFNKGTIRDSFFWNMTYTSNFRIIKYDEWGITGPFWSLSVEEHFYLLWPFIILFFGKKKKLWPIIMTISMAIFIRYLFFINGFNYLYSYIFTFSCFDALGIGGLLAYLHYYKPQATFDRIINNNYLFIIAFLGWMFCLFSRDFISPQNIWNYVFIRVFSSLFFFYLIGRAITTKHIFLHQQHILFLGKISYSMYVIHNFIPGMLLGMKFPAHPYLRFPIYFIILIILSYLAWKYIEMPFNKMKNRFDYKKT